MTVIVDRRVHRFCTCGSPLRVYTHPRAGTRVESSCPPWCEIRRQFALSAGPRPTWFEPVRMDDRRGR